MKMVVSRRGVATTEDPIEKEFRENSVLRHQDIVVSRENGTMILSGQVGSFYLKQMAQEVAKRAIQRSGLLIQLRNDIKVP